MAGLDKRKEERLIKAVKDLSKLPPNKRCADCTEKLPQYVNLTFSTFICTGTGFRGWAVVWDVGGRDGCVFTCAPLVPSSCTLAYLG